MSPTRLRAPLAAGASVLLALALAACGSSSSSSSGSGSGGGAPAAGTLPSITANPANVNNGAGGRRGGTLNVVTNEDAAHLDPGLAYFVIDYEFVYATQRPLYSYLPNNPSTTVPDLAVGQPQISPDNRTVTVHIRPDVHFSPPVNRAVTSSDVAYAIERGFNPHVANPYMSSYFFSLEGGPKASGGPIPGIQTPNKTTIVFKLTKPVASFFAQALSLPISAPVPPEFAKRYDAKTPSAYGNYQVATGPYMLQADATGKVLGLGYQPGKHITLVRNPNWKASTDYRPAYLDRINWSIGVTPEVAGRQALTGSHIVDGDTPSADIVKLAYQRYRSQIFFSPGSGSRYVGLDTQAAPFNNINLRKAVFAGLNRRAMGLARGGALTSTVATHFLYPGVGGFAESGGVKGPAYDYDSNPQGSASVAGAYMKKAGFPSGRYTGGQTITVVGSTGDPAAKDAQIVDQDLLNLGFKTNFRLVDQSVMYSKFCGTPKLEVAVCPNVAWVRDFADPQTVLDPTFNGANIVPTNNSNWSQLNDPTVNAAMKTAELTNGTAARAQAWAKVDNLITADAAAIPWSWDSQANVFSKDVQCVNAVWNTGSCDFSFSSLK